MSKNPLKNAEVGTANEKISRPRTCSEVNEDDLHYLSGKKPFFDVVLSKTHLAPRYLLLLPAFMISLLPRVTIHVVLKHGGKNWDLSYTGNLRCPRFDSRWGTFVEQNHLKVGDACVFELLENNPTKLRFKVVILRNDDDEDMPPELNAAIAIDAHGKTPEMAIHIN